MTQQTKVLQKKETLQVICRALPIRQDNAYSFCLLGRKRKYIKSKTTSRIIRQTNLDRRGLKPFPIICHLLDPPLFLVTDYL
jgi:hypothetical protein